MKARSRHRKACGFKDQSGQAAVEWIGLVLVVALAASALLVTAEQAGLLNGRIIGDAVLQRILCAINGGVACREDKGLKAAYDDDVAQLVRELAPEIVYERRTKAMPVDFRRCRSVRCGDGDDATASITRTGKGLPATAFTRVIDNRKHGGSLYIQYWLYYADSTSGAGRVPGLRQAVKWGSAKIGQPVYHHDDWESYQVRVGPDGKRMARSSAHDMYRGSQDSRKLVVIRHPAAGAGRRLPVIVPRPRQALDRVRSSSVFDPLRCGECRNGWRRAWTADTGWHRVSGGSHAGHIPDGYTGERNTPAIALRLVPLETLRHKERYRFSRISAPWKKRVYGDPESKATG